VTLDSQRRLGPFRPEAVDGLEYAAPDVVQQIVAIEDQGDRDALAGGQGGEGESALHDESYLGADLGFCGVHDGGLDFDMVFGPEAGALDLTDIGVVQKPVEQRGGEYGVVVEDFRPAFERAIGTHQDGATLVALGDDLEQQVGAELVDRQVPDLVHDDERRFQIALHGAFQGAGTGGSRESVDGCRWRW